MPEGPSLRVFQSRCCRAVGLQVRRAGGGSRQLAVRELEGRELQQSQVHGKCLFLGFGARSSADAERVDAGSSADAERVGAGSSARVEADSPSGSGPSGAAAPRLWVRFHFGLFGSVRCDEFARATRANKRGDWQDPSPRLILYFPGGRFLVFYNCRLRVCEGPWPHTSTDILHQDFDQARGLQALQLPQPVCCTLLQQQHFAGLGNIIKNEVLYLSGIHPMSLGSQLSVEKLRTLLEQVLLFAKGWLHNKEKGEGVKYQIYQKEWCLKGHAVERAVLGPPHGFPRLTWWCPVCQPADT